MIPRPHCPACGTAAARPVADLPYDAPPISAYLADFYPNLRAGDFGPLAGARYRLAECGGCGCVFQDPVPDAGFLADFYGRDARALGQPVSTACEPYVVAGAVRELMMIVRSLQPAVPSPCVLDFGTGGGSWALLAAASGLATHACDVSDRAFARLEAAGVHCHRPDALPEGRFDIINAEQVFEHLADPAAVLAALVRALKPAGMIKIGVPHDPGLRRKLAQPVWSAAKNTPESLNAVAPVEHLNHFEPASLRALAARSGLESRRVVGWDLLRAGERPGGGARARLGRWLRARLGDDYRPLRGLTQTIFLARRERTGVPG